jgi:CRISPR-associated protein Csb2
MHYGIEDAPPTGEQRAITRARLWRTVTPAALPQQAVRRRIDPAQKRAEAKGGAERAAEESKAASAVIQALRHAGVPARPLAVRAQREPLEAKGARAEAFAHEPRFAKERLWHVEVTFDGAGAPRGPLILGDGRYLGLGLMQPVKDAWRDVVSFSLAPNSHLALADSVDLTHAVRRALVALSRDHRGDVPPLFSGHEPDGAKARSGRHRHVFIAGTDLDRDDRLDQLIVAAPWACDRSMRPRQSERAMFDRVVGLLEVVRAGKLGVIPLQVSSTDHRLTGTRSWESHTDYHPCRTSRMSANNCVPKLSSSSSCAPERLTAACRARAGVDAIRYLRRRPEKHDPPIVID